MIAKCPFCSYPYEVEGDGKFQCGVCGVRYYLIDGKIITAGNENRFGPGGKIADRFRVIGELYPGSEDVMYCCVDELLDKLVCLLDERPEEGFSKSNKRNRFITLGCISIPGKTITGGNNTGNAVPPLSPAVPEIAITPVTPVTPVITPVETPAVAPVTPVITPAETPAVTPVTPAITPVETPAVAPVETPAVTPVTPVITPVETPAVAPVTPVITPAITPVETPAVAPVTPVITPVETPAVAPVTPVETKKMDIFMPGELHGVPAEPEKKKTGRVILGIVITIVVIAAIGCGVYFGYKALSNTHPHIISKALEMGKSLVDKVRNITF